MVVLVSPRLAVIEQTRVLSITWKALARAGSGVVALHDRTTPPRRPAPTAGASPARAADATAGPGSRRARPAAAPRASARASSARALCACMRIDSVSRPFSTTQALNGDSAMPALRITGTNFSLMSCSLAAERAGDHAALAVEVLGARVDDQVGAELDRPLQRRRAEAVVDRQQRAGVVRDVGQRADVAHLGQRIGRRLGEQQLGVRPHRAPPLARRRSARRRWSRRRTCANSRAEQLDRRAEHAVRADRRGRRPSAGPCTAAGSRSCRSTVPMQASVPSSAARRRSIIVTVGLVKRAVDEASSSLAKRAAAVAASGCTKLLVRNSASEFSPHWLRRQALAHGERVEAAGRAAGIARDLRRRPSGYLRWRSAARGASGRRRRLPRTARRGCRPCGEIASALMSPVM